MTLVARDIVGGGYLLSEQTLCDLRIDVFSDVWMAPLVFNTDTRGFDLIVSPKETNVYVPCRLRSRILHRTQVIFATSTEVKSL